MLFLILNLFYIHAGDPAMQPSNEGGIIESSPTQAVKKSQNLSDLMDVLEKSGNVDADEMAALKKNLKAKNKRPSSQSRRQLRLNDKTIELNENSVDPQANQ